jgi:hypothetical protein
MDPLKVSAQFAAFVWASQGNTESESADDGAARFARNNWATFLPLAHEGLGRLLLQIAAVPETGLRRLPSRRRLARLRQARPRRRSLTSA